MDSVRFCVGCVVYHDVDSSNLSVHHNVEKNGGMCYFNEINTTRDLYMVLFVFEWKK